MIKDKYLLIILPFSQFQPIVPDIFNVIVIFNVIFRIKKKPYVEMSDSDDREDTDIAREAWENYKKRNFIMRKD